MMKTGRNEPCPCGSGRKYKKCCLEDTSSRPPGGHSPAELVEARVRAFRKGDFAFIYETYHSESHFLRQFPDKDAYIRQGLQTLSADYAIRECRVVTEHVESGEATVIFYLDVRFQGARQESFELAFFYLEDGEWRYHCSQKLTREDYDGPVEEIDWSDFEQVENKVYF